MMYQLDGVLLCTKSDIRYIGGQDFFIIRKDYLQKFIGIQRLFVNGADIFSVEAKVLVADCVKKNLNGGKVVD